MIFLITLLVYLIGAASTFYYAAMHYKDYILCCTYQEINWIGVNLWTLLWPLAWPVVALSKVFKRLAKKMQALADAKQKPKPVEGDQWWRAFERETKIERLERELGIK